MMEEPASNMTGIVFDEQMSSHFHLWNDDFTETPERYTKTIERCEHYGLLERCYRIKSRLCTEEEMSSLHCENHIEILKKTSAMSHDDMKTLSQDYDYLYFHQDIWRNSRVALGCTLELVDHVIQGKIRNGMALVRPPGHHAMKDEFNGYCYLNNVAIAAQLAIEKHGLKRILILDWDVHHGQGIQYFFYNDPRVLYISIHKYLYGEEWPYLRESDFDFTGEGEGQGYNVNIPINEIGCDNSSYLAIFFNVVLPLVFEYNPELVLVSAGYDAALGCPEGEMEVTPACFAHFVNLLSPLAEGKICLVLEGGYCIKTLSEGVALSIRALLGDPCPRIDRISSPHHSVVESILNVIKCLRLFWDCFKFQGDLLSLEKGKGENSDVLYWPPKLGIKFYTHDRPETFSLHQDCYNPTYCKVAEELDIRVENLLANTKLSKAPYKTCISYDVHMLLHKDHHSGEYEERPERISHIYETLKTKHLLQRCLQVKGRKATEEELTLVHGTSFIQQLKRAMNLEEEALQQYQSSFKSIYLCKDSFEAASWGVGCTLSVVDSVMTAESQSGFSIVRPPGHHAEANLMMGFCIFNNVGIAARYAQEKYNVQRIMIVDWDIHHGNALQSLFYDDPSVLCISLHRFDCGSFYPYGGEGYHKCVGGRKAQGFNVNIAWNDGSKGDSDYIAAFHHVVLPLAYEFGPDLVLVAAGFDAVKEDTLGGYRLTPAVYGHMTKMLMGLAEGKVILVLEGGYNLEATSDCVSTCVSTLLGDPVPQLPVQVPSLSGAKAIKETVFMQQTFWKSLKYLVDLPTEQQLQTIKRKRKNRNCSVENDNSSGFQDSPKDS